MRIGMPGEGIDINGAGATIPGPANGHDTQAPATRCLVLHPDISEASGNRDKPYRDPRDRLIETIRLAEAIGLEIDDGWILRVPSIKPATLIGQGQVERVAHQISISESKLLIVDAALSPVQQRNLERAVGAKVLDRTGLILEIFGARARTREGQLQVELAALAYQRSRLVRSWTHLERQRGGFGFMGGPGESQIEIDRRLIDERMTRLRRELETTTRTRGLHRDARKRVPYPIVALVGYTNAGKSTLFNRLTRSTVVARDQLFATLDPTMRALRLPSGRQVVLSDTVGFISDLPTQLVAAFRATLEEVLEADLLLHVHDASANDWDAQSQDVENVLKELGIDPNAGNIVSVFNKGDLLEEGDARAAGRRQMFDREGVCVSAVTGAGIDHLLKDIDDHLAADMRPAAVTLDPGDGRSIAWLHEKGRVIDEDYSDGHAVLRVELTPVDWDRFDRLVRKSDATAVIVPLDDRP